MERGIQYLVTFMVQASRFKLKTLNHEMEIKIARVYSRQSAKPKKVKWRCAGRFRCTIHSIDGGALYGIFLVRVHTSDVW